MQLRVADSKLRQNLPSRRACVTASAERIELAGGPEPSFARDKGEVRTRELTEIGIPSSYLARVCDEGLLSKVGCRIYRAIEREVGSLDVGQAVVCGEHS